MSYITTRADELAKQQRSISVAEFFEKNKHLLGFDSPTRGIITTVKEAIDNSLDACEEAGILPDLYVGIYRQISGAFRVVIEDNGPGIIPEQVPFVFGKLLYGSRFHQIRQSRGQQGIGISAAVLYAQITSGTPTQIISRCGSDTKAFLFLIQIHTETNEPDIQKREEITWDRIHGTRIEMVFSSTLSAKKRLIEYLRYTSIVNPHARITATIDEEELVFDRTSDDPIKSPESILPHPHGIELGHLKRLVSAAKLPLASFLMTSFSRVGEKTAALICSAAHLSPDIIAQDLTMPEITALLSAMQQTRIQPPQAGLCLSPIGEPLIRQGLEKEFSLDYVAARTRPAAVYSGHPFLIEAAIGYGGLLLQEGNARILRFANRVPLLYQQGACAITTTIADINWKLYNISQQGLPLGPLIILVHIASTNVPFTSESKDAIASIPDIEREIRLVLQDLGRDLKQFLSRRDRKKADEARALAICAVIPEIATIVAKTVEKPIPDTAPIEGRIMKKLVAKKRTDDGIVSVTIDNYTSRPVDLMAYAFLHGEIKEPTIQPSFIQDQNDETTVVWQIHLPDKESWSVSFRGTHTATIDLRGIEETKKVVIDCDI